MKPKTAKELQRLALERGATLKLDGREFNSSKDMVKRLARLGKPETKPEPKPEPVEPIAALNERLVEEVRNMVEKLPIQQPPHGWHFKVIRDENKLTTDIYAFPLDGPVGALTGVQ